MARKDPREPFTRIDVGEAKEMIRRGSVTVVDVREPHEYETGHVPGAKLIPVASVMERKDELPTEGEIIFICAHGQRSALAAEMAAAIGVTLPLYNLEGGTIAWIEAGEPVD